VGRLGWVEPFCKLAYRRLHQISNSKVFHIAEQVAAGLSALKPDCRGKHATRPHRCSEESLSSVKEHIRSFPTESSHYSRACNMNRQYLSSELTTEKMYKLYQDWCSQKNVKAVCADLDGWSHICIFRWMPGTLQAQLD